MAMKFKTQTELINDALERGIGWEDFCVNIGIKDKVVEGHIRAMYLGVDRARQIRTHQDLLEISYGNS